MKSSALVLAAGLSIFGASLGCDSAGDDAGTGGTTGTTAGTSSGGGKIAVGGSSTGTSGSTGTGGGSANDVSIAWTNSWVDVTSNPLGIQGAIFSYGDDTSKMGMMENFMGANACISGSAAKVDTTCTPVAPATDCYGTFWGAAIGLNLNQPKDAMDMGGTPVAYDASHISGFTFTLGGTVATGGTSVVPSTLRFKVEDANGEYCTWKTVGPGQNTVLFSELETECWNHTKKPGTPATTAQKGLIKIAWQVVTTTGGPTPFDFCVSDLHALTDGTTVTPPAGTGGTPSGSGGTPAGTAGTTSSAGTASSTGGGGAAAAGSSTGGAATGGGGASAGGASAGTGGAAGGSGGTGGS